MRFLRFFLMIFMAASFVPSAQVQAQDKVAARSGAHKGYSRLVFEWPEKPGYSLSKENDRVLVRFAKAGILDSSGLPADDKNVKGVKTLSAAGEPLQIAVTIPVGSRFRDFTVDNKLILDVYDSDAPHVAAKPEAPAPAVKEPAKIKEDAPAAKPAVTVKETAKTPAPVKPAMPVRAGKIPDEKIKSDFTVALGESGDSVPVGGVEAATVPAPSFEPHVITLTTITSVGVAAFERNGSLWIVVDSPDLPVAPQLAGPQKDKFSKLVKVDVPDGAAWRMDMPDGLQVRGEGGGLSWRIVLSAKEQPQDASVPESDNREGKLVWPMTGMRKTLVFTDPVVGDTITAVTSSTADQTGGAGRNFVNLRTLDSVIGLAYVAKSDDVKAAITTQEVSVGRPGGLSLSNARDSQPEKIRAAAETKPEQSKPDAAKEEAKADMPEEAATPEKPEPADHETAPGQNPLEEKTEEGKDSAKEKDGAEAGPEKENSANGHIEKVTGEPVKDIKPAMSKAELTKAAEEKPSGNNIYNFPKWEMGGIPALENNLHVMMVEVSNKEPGKRTEDIITMAKLMLANDRGQESLGLLRIALQQVPELEDNTEFQSLRAAAFALSGKYDQAIDYYGRDSLKNYDDVKYWRAYTLAGLEDWKQAGDVMPSDFTAIASYPSAIRTPLALSFAEVALRGGKEDEAVKILDILKPDLPKLSLPYASSWNYLQGEAARQKGDAKSAIEYWQPLVKNGKDDLFRAKAGLSLTKLQLDQKKIKPGEAIDRLEGLRYAWRGDELETLINYRLGQMYIDNKDYLKGLTVLRNATTLTPELQIGTDVKNYMVKSFQDIFLNDRLNSVSPLEAISLYEEFKDLLPPGSVGDDYVDKLSERLVDADLLGRAAALLDYQVANRLQGDRKAETAIRLAAIRLLDGNPDGALRSLDVAQDTLNKIDAGLSTAPVPKAAPKGEDETSDPSQVTPEAGDPAAPAAAPPAPAPKADPEKQRQVYLLRARALSMKKQPDEAIAILDKMRPDADVNKLRTDIAWTAGKWEEAAMSLGDLITSEDISPKRPLTEYQRDIVLNRAIALNLSANRVALANLRERFNAQMKGTTKGQMFEVVTRPRRPDMIGSREAIESMISEIDLFKGFLDGYTKMDALKAGGSDKTPAAEPAAPKEAVPAEGKAAEVAPVPGAAKAAANDASTAAAGSDAAASDKAAVPAVDPSKEGADTPAAEAAKP